MPKSKRARRIHASRLRANQLESLTLSASAEFSDLEAKEGKRPTFSINAYTGSVMQVSGFFSPVVVDLDGLKAMRPRIPILLNHDDTRIVGMGEPAIDSSGARITGTVTADDANSETVVGNARNGFEWQASIGANITRREFLEAGKRAVVNGREVNGPLVIAREAVLGEVSFVAMGADHQTSAVVAATQSRKAIDMDPAFKDWLVANGFEADALDEKQAGFLKAAWEAEKSAEKKAPDAPQLDTILATKKKEQERINSITDLASKALDENPRQVEQIEALSRLAIEAGWDTQKFELELLRGSRHNGVPRFTREPDKLNAKVIEASLLRSGGYDGAMLEKQYGEQILEAADRRHPHGVGLQELLLIFARENGCTHLSASMTREVLEAAFHRDVRAQGFSTLSLPGILSNVANKFLLAGFNAVDTAWREISAIRSVRDFKTVTSYILTGALEYEKVGPAGEIKHGDLGEVSYTNKAETYAKMLAITRHDIINDDLNALTNVPRMLGRGAAKKLNDVFWSTFLANSDFFKSGNNNVSTGADSALGTADGAAINKAEVVFMNQTDPDGKPLGTMPRIILVPPTLMNTAARWMGGQLIVTGQNTTLPNVNVYQGRYRAVSSSYMENSAYTGNSTAAWYLLADPTDLAAIEVAFLNGQQAPTVETADVDFNTLGIQMRGYHDFGVALQEFRAGVRSAGS